MIILEILLYIVGIWFYVAMAAFYFWIVGLIGDKISNAIRQMIAWLIKRIAKN